MKSKRAGGMPHNVAVGTDALRPPRAARAPVASRRLPSRQVLLFQQRAPMIKPVLLVAFAAASWAANATDARGNEAFAIQMLTCAHKHMTFALGPGTASAAQQAKLEAQKYLNAATASTSEMFVSERTKEVRETSQKAVLQEFKTSKSVDEMKTRWAETVSACDAALSASR
jgi:hypothetical protein